MIITRPSCVNVDSGDQSGLPARTGNNDSLLLALWSWRSWQKRQESVSPRSIGDVAPSSPPIALPSFVPTTIPSSSSVVTSHTRSFSSSDELDPTSPSPSIPLETPPVSSNTLPPRSTPPVIYPTESDTVSEGASMSSLQTPVPTTISTSTDFPISSSSMTPSSSELEVTDGGLGLYPGFNSAVTGMNNVTSDSQLKHGNSTRSVHDTMVGAALVSILLLLLLGIIFYLRRRVIRKSSSPAIDTSIPTPAGVSSYPMSPQTTRQQEGSTIQQDRDSFIDRNIAPRRESAFSIASAHGQRGHSGRRSQISIASSISKSIRFAMPGSLNSSTGSPISRATMSVVAVDGTHSPCDESLGEPVSPWRPTSVNTTSEYSASWRGTNLSNIINAARGVKG